MGQGGEDFRGERKGKESEVRGGERGVGRNRGRRGEFASMRRRGGRVVRMGENGMGGRYEAGKGKGGGTGRREGPPMMKK